MICAEPRATLAVELLAERSGQHAIAPTRSESAPREDPGGPPKALLGTLTPVEVSMLIGEATVPQRAPCSVWSFCLQPKLEAAIFNRSSSVWRQRDLSDRNQRQRRFCRPRERGKQGFAGCCCFLGHHVPSHLRDARTPHSQAAASVPAEPDYRPHHLNELATRAISPCSCRRCAVMQHVL